MLSTAGNLNAGGKSRRNSWELLLADECELSEGRYDKDGNVIAVFKLDWNIPSTLEIVFGKKSRFFPVEAKWTLVLPEERRLLLSHQLIRWKKEGTLFVPVQLKAISNQPSGGTKTFEIDFDWRLDKEVPPELIASSMPDWRENIRTLFDVDWQRQGVAPPDLVIEEEEVE